MLRALASAGTATSAMWEGCPSKAMRSIVCRPTFGGSMPEGFDALTCDCLGDGTKTWFFDAKTPPPLASRADAERVAEASCKMW